MARGSWSTGLCDYFSDCHTCCLTACCPCVAFGRIANILDRDSSSCVGFGCIFYLLHWTRLGALYTWNYRGKMRKEYNLEGDGCGDFCLSCFCEYCVICQQYRELKNRGFDVGAGWEETMRRKQGVAMAPAVEGGMKRYSRKVNLLL